MAEYERHCGRRWKHQPHSYVGPREDVHGGYGPIACPGTRNGVRWFGQKAVDAKLAGLNPKEADE